MKVLLSWVREFVDIDRPAEEIGGRLSLRGLALEGIERRSAPSDPSPDARGAHPDEDWLLDFDVTANRPDCLSMAGIAREIATVYGLPFREPASRWPAPSPEGGSSAGGATSGLPITIEAPDLCGRYVGAMAEVRVGPSPAWMAERLAACGVRPISNIVDITNYVLLEMGQPMHAFDHGCLAGPAIVVRRARAGESLETLDGRTRPLTPEMLVIADAERPAALGGIMGGLRSEVSATTRRIVFESAWFLPQSVRATSRALGLRTEASMRFERGADPAAPGVAMARACELLARLDAGALSGPFIDVSPRVHRPEPVFLAQPRVEGLLGMPVPDAEVVRILTALGFTVTPAPGGWTVTAPAWRVDIRRDVDLIEEVGRHHGFEHLPATFPSVRQAPPPSDARIPRDAAARRLALARGFSEAISFAFIESRQAAPFHGEARPVTLANPLSEKFAVMRPSLLPGLIDAVSHNRRHGRRDIQLFEIGTRFAPHGESRGIALAWTGLATPDHWSGARRDADFFDIKGAIEQLAALFDATLTATPPRAGSIGAEVLVAGRAAELWRGEVCIGLAGQLAPTIAEAHEVPANDVVWVAEVDLDALSAGSGATRQATPLPRYPAVVRDIALLLDDSLSAATVRGTIQAQAPNTLVSAVEFDRYLGKGIPDGKVSLALRLTFQSPERTLTDAEVDASTLAVVQVLTTELGAVRR